MIASPGGNGRTEGAGLLRVDRTFLFVRLHIGADTSVGGDGFGAGSVNGAGQRLGRSPLPFASYRLRLPPWPAFYEVHETQKGQGNHGTDEWVTVGLADCCARPTAAQHGHKEPSNVPF